MMILGLSGVAGTVEFKRQHWPGLEEREYRITQGHDSAAVLVVDGEVVAAVAEERISRHKHTGDFPAGAIAACLGHTGVQPRQLDEVVHSFDFAPYRMLYQLDPISAQLYREVLSPDVFAAHVNRAMPDLRRVRIGAVEHHLAHAASAYHTSGWDECVVIVVDGMGEAHGATVYRARRGQLEPVHRISAADSIGIFYSVVTLHLGFDFNADEYKVMGLAPYGDPNRFRDFFAEHVRLRQDGGWDIPLLKLKSSRGARETHSAARDHLSQSLIPARQPESEISVEHKDVAAGLQSCLDRAMLHLCAHFGRRLGLSKLALAGGVALNTTANARLLAAGFFEEIYIQPAAADDGSAMGAALHRAAEVDQVKNRRSPTPFYGPAPSAERLATTIRRYTDRVRAEPLPSLDAACEAAAEVIASGGVIAWYRGRMEFGPRALGHRSILADPGDREMRDRVNALVKLREAFRPFAPAVSLREVSRWFEVPEGTELPYMNINVQVRTQFRTELPATTHVDGSARVQTVAAHDNGEFLALLQAVGRHTGREMVLNTSFNVRGQPIVNTPGQAVETFLGTGLDALMLENTLIRRR